ncbi:MAG TPA: DUF6049 family protein [Acidimicrobiales bacterium]
MSLRCARAAGIAALAFFLGASLVVGFASASAGAATAAAATADSTGSGGSGGSQSLFTLAWQTATVQPLSGTSPNFTLDLETGPGEPAGSEVGVTLYGALHTRSNFEQTLNTAPSGTPITRTTPVAVSTLPPGKHGGRALGIDVVTSATTPTGGTPNLDLDCTPGTCTGVYPAVVSLYRSGDSTAPIAHFTTYLTYVENKSTPAASLRFAWIVPVAAPVAIRSGERDPATAIDPPTTSAATALDHLVTSLSQYAQVPVTIEPSPQTVQAMNAEKGAEKGAGHQATETLADLSHNQTTHEIPAQSYVPIDLGALAGAGESGEITGQMTQGAAVLRTLGVATTSRTASWVANGPVGSALGTGLAQPQVGAKQVVVPDSALASPDTDRGTWSSTFQIAFGKGSPTFAGAASDGELAAHFTADPRDPALAATQLLADLAMIHFERPNTTGTGAGARGVVAVPPAGWAPNASFDDQLLAGLATNPVVTPVTLDDFFTSVRDGGPRHLQSGGPGPTLPPGLSHQISTARLRLTDFDSVVRPRSTPVLTQLDQLLLAAEAANLSSPAQSAGVATFGRSLGAQLAQVTFAAGRSITLTARTGSIPITILSTAPYTVVGRLIVSSDKFQFPQGSSRQLTIDHATTPVRIQVEARTSGDLPIEAQLAAGNGSLVIAQGQLTVRSTATSIVGIILTAAALVVLLAWWARTWQAGRRKKRAAKGRRAATE